MRRTVLSALLFLLVLAAFVFAVLLYNDRRKELQRQQQAQQERLREIEADKQARLQQAREFNEKLDQLLAGNKMIRIVPGSFQMGSQYGARDERPVHWVTIGRAFLLSQYEVTFAQYEQFAQATGRQLPDDRNWGRGDRPVVKVSWLDAQAYAQWLSEQTGLTFRLPSEAEWEYAARAGTTTKYAWGDDVDCRHAKYGFYLGHCGSNSASPVGSYQPNAWGLYDMHGNVWEWVQDCSNDSYRGAPSHGEAWTEGNCQMRGVRGGSWEEVSSHVSSATRNASADWSTHYDVGFRLAQDL